MRYSSNLSMTAAERQVLPGDFSSGISPLSVSTTEDAVTSSSVCGACRSKAVTAVPQ